MTTPARSSVVPDAAPSTPSMRLAACARQPEADGSPLRRCTPPLPQRSRERLWQLRREEILRTKVARFWTTSIPRTSCIVARDAKELVPAEAYWSSKTHTTSCPSTTRHWGALGNAQGEAHELWDHEARRTSATWRTWSTVCSRTTTAEAPTLSRTPAGYRPVLESKGGSILASVEARDAFNDSRGLE
jgi:hypothetical protein